MPTVEQRYTAATARVRSTIATIERQRIGYAIDESGAARWYTGRKEAAALRGVLAPIETRWLRATSVDDRARAAREAEQLADRIAPRASAQGCERDAGLIDIQTPGSTKAEMNTVEGLIRQLDRDVKASNVSPAFKAAWQDFVDEWHQFYKDHSGWFDRFWYAAYEKTVEFRKRLAVYRRQFIAQGGTPAGPTDTAPETAGDQVKKIGKWLLIGGGIYAAFKVASGLLSQRPERAAPRQASSAKALNKQLVIEAESADERNAKAGFGPLSMCPVCHRYKNLDENGRIEPHEYPSGGMCPGEGRLPLWPHGRPRPARASKSKRKKS